jgi:general secretion pathway protein G
VLERSGLDAVARRAAPGRAGAARRGFTIIELLVVVVILGLLAAVLVFTVGDSGDRARANACEAERVRVENAMEAYKAKTGSYPQAMGDLMMAPTRYLRFLPRYYVLSADRESGEIVATGECAEE